jgi:hypothetical protein
LEFLEARFEAGFLFGELHLLGGEFLDAHEIPLLLQIERVDFVAGSAELLRDGKKFGLGFAEFLLAI